MASGLTSGSLSIIPPNNPVSYTYSTPNPGAGNPVTLTTVAAGKTLYITGGFITNSNTIDQTYELLDDAATIFTVTIPPDQTFSFAGQPVVAIAAGHELNAVPTVGNTLVITLWGFLLP